MLSRRQTTTKLVPRRRHLAFEELEDRRMLALLSFLSVPALNATGDAVGDGTVEYADGAPTASYHVMAFAGLGPGSRIWNRSHGSFSLSQPLRVEIQPEAGEAAGTPVVVSVDGLLDAVGGTGAGVFPGGKTELIYGVTFTAPDASGFLLQPGVGTPTTFYGSPTIILDQPIAKNLEIAGSFEAKIGDTFEIHIELSGDSGTWQGGFTKQARGYVTADLQLGMDVVVTPPDFVPLGLQVDDSGIGFVQWFYETTATLDDVYVEGGLYWSTDEFYGAGDALAHPFAVNIGRGNHEGGVFVDKLDLSQFSYFHHTYLVLALDTFDPNPTDGIDGAVEEFDETNDGPHIQTLQPHETGLQIVGDAYKGEGYRVVAKVKSRSLVPDPQFRATVTSSGHDDPPTQSNHDLQFRHLSNGTAEVSGTLQPYATVEFAQTVIDDWNWIPRENPVDNVLSPYNGDMWVSIFSGKYSAVFDWIKSAGGTFASRAASFIGGAYDVVSSLSTVFDITPHDQQKIDYRLDVSSGLSASNVVVDESTSVKVRDDRMQAYVDFNVLYVGGQVALGTGVSLLAGGFFSGGATFWPGVGAFMYGLGTILRAGDKYNLAFDPPDPNYEEFVVPQRQVFSAEQTLADGIPKQLVVNDLAIASLESARIVSRDRADGARLADDVLWESRQLWHASDLASQSAILQTRRIGQWTAASDLFEQVPAGVDAAGIAHLSNHGFPVEIRQVFSDFGFTDNQIDHTLQTIIDTGPVEATDAPSKREEMLAAAALTAQGAIEDAALAIQRQLSLGESVATLLSETYERLQITHDNIAALIASSPPRLEILDRIEAHIDDVRRVLDETNDLENVVPLLTDAYALLVAFQLGIPTLDDVVDRVEQLNSNGHIPDQHKSTWQEALTTAKSKLKEGDVDGTVSTLVALVQDVANSLTDGVGFFVVEEIVASIASIHDFLHVGASRHRPRGNPDATVVLPNQSTVIDVLANDESQSTGNVLLLGVQSPAVGTTTVDNGTTPGDGADDQVVYTAPAQFESERFAYVVGSTDSVELDLQFVDVYQQLPLDVESTILVDGSSLPTRGFLAQAGDAILLEATEQDFDDPNRLFQSLDDPANASYVTPDQLVPIVTDGVYTLTWESSRSDTNPQDDRFIFRNLAGSPVLDKSAPRSVVLGPGETMYLRVNRLDGDRYLFEVDQTSGPDGYATAYARTPVPSAHYFEYHWLSPDESSIVHRDVPVAMYVELKNSHTTDAIALEVKLARPTETQRQISIGEIVDDSRLEFGQEIVYTFQGNASQRLYFDTLGVEGWPSVGVLTSPYGDTVLQVDRFTSFGSGDVPFVVLPEDGTYQFRVFNDFPETSIQFRFLDIETAPSTLFNDPTDVVLNQGDSPIGHEATVVRFTGTGGHQIIAISESFESGGNNNTDVATTWEIIGIDESTRGFATGVSSIDKGIVAELPESGEYAVVVSTIDQDVARLDFRLQDFRANVRSSLDVGDVALAAIDEPHKTLKFDIELVRDELYFFEPGTQTGAPLQFLLSSPQGNVSMFARWHESELFSVPSTGVYCLTVVASDAGQEGTTTVRISRASDLARPIEVGESRSVTLQPGERQLFDIHGEVQSFIAIRTDAPSSSNVLAQLYRPDGKLVAHGRDAHDPFVLEVANSDELTLGLGNNSDAPTTFALSVHEAVEQTLPLNWWQPHEFSLDQVEIVNYEFDGEAGQVIFFDSIQTGNTPLFGSLHAPDGRPIFDIPLDEDSPFPLELPETGLYRLRFAKSQGGAARFSFRPLNLSTAPVVPFGSLTSGSTNSSQSSSPARTIDGYRFAIDPEFLYTLEFKSGSWTHVPPPLFLPDGTLADWFNGDTHGKFHYEHPANASPGEAFLLISGHDPNWPFPEAGPYEFILTQSGNQSPIAVPDEYSVFTGNTIFLDPTLNDYDNDGTIVATSFEFVVEPQHGDFHVSRDPATLEIGYSPREGFVGTDTFSYTVADNLGKRSNEVTISIEVIKNEVPVAFDDIYSGPVNRPIAMNVVLNDLDVDGTIAEKDVVANWPQHGDVLYVPEFYLEDGAYGDSHPAGIGTAAIAGVWGRRDITLVVSGSSPSETGDFALFVKTNLADRSEINVGDFDLRFDGTLTTSAMRTFTLPGRLDAVPFVAWTSNSVGIGRPLTRLQGNQIAGLIYTPDAEFQGVDWFTYQAEDNRQAFSNEAMVRLYVGDAPTIDPVSDVQLAFGSGEQLVDMTGISTGQGPGPIRVTASTNHPLVSGTPEIQYTSPDSTAQLLLPLGMASSGEGAITVRVENGGTDNDLSSIEDNLSSAVTFLVLVAPPDERLAAVSDEFTVDENNSLTIEMPDILVNDVVSGGLSPEVQLVAPPQYGDLDIAPGGDFIYTPSRNVNRTDTFAYRLVDGDAIGNSAQVQIAFRTPYLWYNGWFPTDLNDDGRSSTSDLVLLAGFLFLNGQDVLPSERADGTQPPFYDVNRDNRASVADLVAVASFLFLQNSGSGEPVWDVESPSRERLVVNPGEPEWVSPPESRVATWHPLAKEPAPKSPPTVRDAVFASSDDEFWSYLFYGPPAEDQVHQ